MIEFLYKILGLTIMQ